MPMEAWRIQFCREWETAQGPLLTSMRLPLVSWSNDRCRNLPQGLSTPQQRACREISRHIAKPSLIVSVRWLRDLET